MKTSTKLLAAVSVTAALALAGAAIAHPGFGPGWGGGMGPGMGPGMMGGYGPGMMGGYGGPGMMGGWGPGMMGGYGPGADMSAAAAGRLAEMKAYLKITPAQEGAWKTYESTVTQQATAMQALRDKFHAEWQNAKPGATPDFAAHRQEMFALRESGWQAQEKARADLFSALTPEQQALMGGGWGPRGWHRR